MNPQEPHLAGPVRRLLAIVYDGLLLLAVLFLASALPLLFTGGEAVAAGNPFYTGYLLMICFLFYGWFWTHGGQTLGMRAWKIQLQQSNGEAVSWRHALVRFLTAIPAWFVFGFGIILLTLADQVYLAVILQWAKKLPGWLVFFIGLAWLLADNRRNTWRDRLSHTRVIHLSKK